jgi:hypothetical protein
VCGIVLYVADKQAASLRWDTIENNTIYVGNPADTIRHSNPACGIVARNGTDPARGNWIKDITVRNNIIETFNRAADPQPAFHFERLSFPDTWTIENNLIWNDAPGSPGPSDVVMQIDKDAYPVEGKDAGNYDFARFQAYSPKFSGNLYADPKITSASPSYTLEPHRFDFNLAPGSPAIGKAAAAGAPTVDERNLPRSGAPDIGAYQHRAAAHP